MAKLESIANREPDYRFGALVQHAIAARVMLECAWSRETAFQGIKLQPDDRPSRGQCGVSSLWFARHLQSQSVESLFTEGKIHLRSDVSDDHVWVEVRGIGEDPLVVDLTSDQYRSPLGTATHIGSYAEEAQTIGCYTPETHLSPDEVPRRKLLARFALLEQNIAQLPRRRQLRVRN